MSGATIAVLILGTLIFGVLLCAIAVFFYSLLKTVKELSVSVGKLTAVSQTIADDRTLKNLGPSLQSLTQWAPLLHRSFGNLVEVIKVWNELVIASNNAVRQTRGQHRTSVATETDTSAVYHSEESDFARQEAVAALRKQGIAVDEMEENAPLPQQVVVVEPEEPPPPGS